MAAGEGEVSAVFQELYPRLCRFLTCLLGDRHGAQDIAQETFLRLHRFGIGRLSGDERRYWLYRVARNLALNELGRRRTRTRLIDEVGRWFRPDPPTPEARATEAETSSLILEVVKSLPEHQRAVLLLREQEDMSYREIARVLDISEAKVRVDLFRARTAARARWRELHPETPAARKGQTV
jgi:RNA polymerase sigma factor (sigma-70 family)